jgi:recombinational DNA repair ATPase RecF
MLFDRDNTNIIEDIYFCPCCNSLRDSNHNKVSKKYCMQCKKKVNSKIIVVKKEGLYSQFCQGCYDELKLYGIV